DLVGRQHLLARQVAVDEEHEPSRVIEVRVARGERLVVELAGDRVLGCGGTHGLAGCHHHQRGVESGPRHPGYPRKNSLRTIRVSERAKSKNVTAGPRSASEANAE